MDGIIFYSWMAHFFMFIKRCFSLLVLLSVLLAGCREQPLQKKIRPVRAMRVEKDSLLDMRRFPGRTQAVDRVNLSFRVDGVLIERPVLVGDSVPKGGLLARLDPRDYEVSLRNIEGSLQVAEAKLRFAESDLVRVERIWEKDPGAISESFLDQKTAERDQLIGEVASLKAQVEAAKDALSYTTLAAPFEGIVVATYVENFEFVSAKQPIVRLLDITQVEMSIDVPDSLINEIPGVQELIVQFEMFPGREFPAKLKEIGTEASVTTRTFPVTLVIDQPSDLKILSGMVGEARFTKTGPQESAEQLFVIPPSALFSDQELGQSFVWVIDPADSVVHRRKVMSGALTTRGMSIQSGLNEGEWIVTAGVHYLSDGEFVRIQGPNSVEHGLPR